MMPTEKVRCRRSGLLVTLATALGWGVLAPSADPVYAATAPRPAQFTYTLQPTGTASAVESIRVSVRVNGSAGSTDRALVELPLVTSNVPTVAAGLGKLDARDARGQLELQPRDEGTGPSAVRRWYPSRRIEGAVTLSYAVQPAGVDAPRGAAPPLDLRSEAGAISAGAAVMLLRPLEHETLLDIQWDLSRSPPATLAYNSPLPTAGSVNDGGEMPLDQVYLMVGQLHRYPVQHGNEGFYSAWQGNPPFDAPALMQWTSTLYGHFERFFGTDPAPYAVFMRHNPVNAGGGMGMNRSFVVTYGANGGSDPEDLKFTLSHEMFHTFQPSVVTADEDGGQLAGSWFNEGLAVYYQRELPLRLGLITADAYLGDLNQTAARYYTNALGNVPNKDIPAGFWQDTRIRTLPYDRGFLYLATVDEAVRRASGGRRTLDDLMLSMKALEKALRRPLTVQDWSELLRKEVGPQAVADFERSLAGETPLPGSDAFGPCFRRTTRALRRYQLGFEPAVLTASPRIVRGLIPGSTAEAAGLRNGDEIVKPVPQDRIQGMQGEYLQLSIRRGDATLEISYLPRGEVVQAWQWERVPAVPDDQCVRRRAAESGPVPR